MKFDRLLVRHKLNLLVIVPMIAVLGLSVPFFTQRIEGVQRSNATSHLMNTAKLVSRLVEDIQREQLLLVASLAPSDTDRSALLVQTATVQEDYATVIHSQGTTITPALSAALTRTQTLDTVRSAAARGTVTAARLDEQYDGVVTGLVDALDLDKPRSGSVTDVQRQFALNALVRWDVAGDSENADVLATLIGPSRGQSLAAATLAAEQSQTELTEFDRLATPDQVSQTSKAVSGPLAGNAARVVAQIEQETARAGFRLAPGAVVAPANVFFISAELRLLVANTITEAIQNAAGSAARSGEIYTAIFLALLLLLIVAVTLLSSAIGRSISRPLQRLTLATQQVADATERELRRVADDDLADSEPASVITVNIASADEIGDLASAVNLVQARAFQLLGRQVVSQRNIATMFASIGRRTLNLADRQLSTIDILERDEINPKLLESLYQLDHLTNRLRRNANSVIVLSGRTDPFGFGEPQPLSTVIRSTLAEIEDFRRVDFGTIENVQVTADVIAPLGSILSELLENAVSFSPPNTMVELTATRVSEGCLITIVDHGVGMTPDRVTEENARLLRRERLDLMPTDMLGLFVVGRLSRQTGISVAFESDGSTGVVVWVTLPQRYLIRPSRRSELTAGPGAGTAPGSPAAGPGGAPTGGQRVDADSPRTPQPSEGGWTVSGPRDAGRTPPPPPDAAGLPRRVAGTHLANLTGIREPNLEAPTADPERIRAEISQFESGAERAISDQIASEKSRSLAAPDVTSDAPPVPRPDAPAAPESREPRSGPAPTGDAPAESDGSHADDGYHTFMRSLRDDIRSLQEPVDWFGNSAATSPAAGSGAARHRAGDQRPGNAPAPPPPPPPPAAASGHHGLVRRVPGATLPPEFRAAGRRAPQASVAASPRQDPASARAALDEFEAGITRAEAETNPNDPMERGR